MPSSPLRRLQAPKGCCSLGFWSGGLPAGILLTSPPVRALPRLRTTFFLGAVTSGLRYSQHLETLRHPSWLVASAVGLRELLATSPRCWAKFGQLGLSLYRSLLDSSLGVRWYASPSLPCGCSPDGCQMCVSSCTFSTPLLACDVAYPLSPPTFQGVRGLSGTGSWPGPSRTCGGSHVGLPVLSPSLL